MKVVFKNDSNKLSAEFSTETPLMFLEKLNGNSCGSDAVTYRPLEYDGQLFISANLTARTVQLTVNFGGKDNGRYLRKKALSRWQEIQRVFVPGQYGTLTCYNGDDVRFIRCRTSETPAPTEILPFLFRAEFELIADSPLWFDGTENSITLASGGQTITNDCGIAVPFTVDVPASSSVFIVLNVTTGKRLAFINNVGESFTIDTAACTVTTASGKLVNNMLSVDSEFWKLVPGENVINCSGITGVKLNWRKAYMGVGV